MSGIENELAAMEADGWKALEGMTASELKELDGRIQSDRNGALLDEENILMKGLRATARERNRRNIEAMNAEREKRRKWDNARSAAKLIVNAKEIMEYTRGIEFPTYEKPEKPLKNPESMSDAELERIVRECKLEIENLPKYDDSLFFIGLLDTSAAKGFTAKLVKAAEARDERVKSLESNLEAASAEQRRRMDAEAVRAARAEEIKDKLADIVESLDSRISQLESGK